ncbi:polysaccharide biosynthesis/export family protein [Sphingomonas azotifigens]|uniref:polysaccharide biosynthesis/export family protein n=1 Tax=Sphingomonas azotifigens TaxID=330920 RepID=UPI001FEC9E12|nr:polysaccharide biosynthesis/export family protein [Sphingomonas azotifigens]
MLAHSRIRTFADNFGEVVPSEGLVQSGDVLDIAIWEAPPAVLFGSALGRSSALEPMGVSRQAGLPEQMVDRAGLIRVPFAGNINAAGRTPNQIAADIRGRLVGKAHDPQVIVRISRNATSDVTVVGEVSNSLRMPLTSKGERLLDALATAGGVRQPVGKMSIQVTRGGRVEAMALGAVIKDPRQNIRLQAGDVVTLLFQPYSFTVLGAARSNQEIPFEGTGVTLSQAFGRMGGLEDQRANPKGVFIFRFENPEMFDDNSSSKTPPTNKIPVIYRVDLRDPKTLFVAQNFFIEDKDVIYVSNAPLADFSKFLQAVSQIVYPIATLQSVNLLR